MKCMRLGLVVVAACGSSHPGGNADAPGTNDAQLGGDARLDAVADAVPDAPPDAPAGPSGVDCFTEWSRLNHTCAAPTITGAFLTQDCGGTTGIYVVGSGFQSSNLFEVNNGWMPHGPQAVAGEQTGRDTWNVLTPTFLCLTTNNDLSPVGSPVQLKNPDGQLSNTVTVTNKLSGRPPLPTTDSTDPFDTDACLEAGMTQQEALAHFAQGASTASIGSLDIVSHTRSCNASTGCLPWSTSAAVSTTPIGLAISNNHVDLTLNGADCEQLGEYDDTLTYNYCGSSLAPYSVHVAAHCLMLWRTDRTTVANDGSYTQTDTGAVLRF